MKRNWTLASLLTYLFLPFFLSALLPPLMSCQHMPVGTAKTRQEQEDDILEAVFRYQFEHCPYDFIGKQTTFYLTIADFRKGTPPFPFRFRDPNDAFMNRFQSQNPKVKKHSEITYADSSFCNLSAGNIKWLNNAEVEVMGEYFIGVNAGALFLYHLVRAGNRWIVTFDKMMGIS